MRGSQAPVASRNGSRWQERQSLAGAAGRGSVRALTCGSVRALT